jgi:hypothetical protein
MRFFWVSLFLIFPSLGFSQESEKAIKISPDVHFRSFWMSTNYAEDFRDDYALGASLYLGAKVDMGKQLKFQLGYRSFANLWSSDISAPDPFSGQMNRYETGLFDLMNPQDRFFGKLETLSIEYQKSNWGAKLGRMGINTDWINAQDGRLSPTAVEGVQVWFAPSSHWKINLHGLTRMSIRGSSSWADIGETVGIYPVGRSVGGKPAQYFGNTESEWIGIWEIDHRANAMDLHFSQTLVNNISSTYWARLEKSFTIREKEKILLGFQTGFQHGIGSGGNEDLALQYKNPKDKNWAVSGRIGYSNSRWVTHLNYTKVGGKGRWLSPREWGKDAWYTFVPRERNEGFEDIDAVVGYLEYRFPKNKIQVYAHIGYHFLPDLDDAAANKYAFPSYRQVNIGLKYKPKTVKNLDFHFLLMNKESLENKSLSPNQRYNKVDILHFNAIANWKLN